MFGEVHWGHWDYTAKKTSEVSIVLVQLDMEKGFFYVCSDPKGVKMEADENGLEVIEECWTLRYGNSFT